MSGLHSKMEFLYQETLRDIRALVDQVERAGGQMDEKAAELRRTLTDISTELKRSRQSARARMVAVFFAGVVSLAAAEGAGAMYAASAGYWVGQRHERKVVDAVEASGVDVTTLSAADIRARLTYSAEQGRVLIEALGLGEARRENNRRHVLDFIVDWLVTLEGNWREAFDALLRAVTIAMPSPAKTAAIGAVAGLTEQEASEMASPQSEVRILARHFANLPYEARVRAFANCTAETRQKR